MQHLALFKTLNEYYFFLHFYCLVFPIAYLLRNAKRAVYVQLEA